MSFFKRITESGVTHESNISKKRNVVLSNYIALVLSIACFTIFGIIPQNHNWFGFLEMMTGAILFSLAIVLNYFSFTNVSRLYLSWLPPILITWYTALNLSDLNAVSVSSYDGLRFYLLAFGCIPYLIMNRDNSLLYIAAIIPGLTCILFCDFFLDQIGVGYNIKGIADNGYWLTPIRVFVSYLIISASSMSLNLIIARGDELNQALLSELAAKNKLIQDKAQSDLSIANRKLKKNISELRKREFILNTSQKIAKVGSWEYEIKDSKTFWSEEMFTIFGLDKNNNPKDLKFEEFLVGNDAEIFTNATIDLLRNKKPYDLTVRTKTPFGYSKWIRIYSFPIEKKGDIIGARGICHDITLYRESEELLKERETKYKNIFEQANDPILITDLTGIITDVNESFCKLFGYQKFELIYKHADSLMEPNDLKNNPVRVRELLSNESVKTERKMLHKDNSVLEVELSAKKFSEDRVMAFLHDVTELRKVNKKIGELKLMALRSVMSPHFIFNVLNSIQFYIAKNDRLNAINYLSKFSKLIRSVLTHSVDNKINLSEEIELLRNYIELELTRFEDKFDYVINIDEELDTDSIEIPSLLIQPYVENAILHGLYNKQEKGMLTINIHDHGDAVLFVIEDNGIGRKAATELKQKNFPTHKSMGINLTEERLQLINERHNVEFKVDDLENEGATGTRVTIGVIV